MAEHDADECQAAMEALLLVAEQDGPPMFARIGVMRALNATSSACSMRRAKTNIGDRGNWREIGDGRCVGDNLRKQADENGDRRRPLIDRHKAPLGPL